jgi:hypothetical protein
LGKLAGIVGEPTSEELTEAIKWLHENVDNTLDFSDLHSKEIGALELMNQGLVREAAALLML